MSDVSSCLHVPAGSRFLRVYDFMLEICDGNECAAALLAFFASWHDTKLKQRQQAHAANDVAERHGEPRAQGESLWQWHTEEELEAGVMFFKRRSFPKAIALLTKKGFIKVSSNPNKKYKFDRTRYFRLAPEAVNKAIAARQRKIADSKSKSASRSGENAGAITDTSSDTSRTNVRESRTRKRSSAPDLPFPDEFRDLTDELREIANTVLGDDWSPLVDVRVEHIAWVARADSQGVLQKDWRAAWRMWLTLAIKRERDKGVKPEARKGGAGDSEETLEDKLRRRKQTGEEKR